MPRVGLTLSGVTRTSELREVLDGLPHPGVKIPFGGGQVHDRRVRWVERRYEQLPRLQAARRRDFVEQQKGGGLLTVQDSLDVARFEVTL